MRAFPLLVVALLLAVELRAAPSEPGGWSKPVNGLQARLSFAINEVINGTPIIVTYLELRNVSALGNLPYALVKRTTS